MVLKNALVLKDAFSDVIEADIVVEDGVIAKVGRVEGGGLVLSGKLIMPAFYNTHTHAAMTLMRGVSDDDPLDVWLFKKVLPLEEKLDGRMIYFGTMMAMMEMARKGIAGFVDMYFFLEDIAMAVEDFGMRAIITRGLVDDGGDDGGRLKENLDFAKRWAGHELVKPGLGPHSPYTCSLDYLKKIADVAKVEELPVTMHLYEAAWERDEYDAEEILNIFEGVHLIVAHAVQFEPWEVKRLKKERLYVSHNPSSNLKLGNGVAPVSDMLKSGVNVSLGTDGAASNNSLDIWHEMRLATLLQKMKSPRNLTVEEAMFMATEAGAMAMGVKGGRIEEGMVADLVVVDLSKPWYEPKGNLKSHIVHAGSSCDVFATMVNGEWVYFDGRYPRIDSEEVLKGFKDSVRRLMA